MSLALRSGAAFLAASAFLKAFPHAEVISSGASDLGFSCSFLVKERVSSDALPIIEEHLRALITEEEPFQLHEMVPKVAEEWFKSKKQFERAKQAKGKTGLLFVGRRGDFLDLIEAPIAPEKVKWIELVKLVELAPSRVLLEGVVFSEREELKAFLKNLKREESYPLLPPLPGCKDEGSLAPEGVLLLNELFDIWRSFVQKEGATLIETPRKVDPSVLKESGFQTPWEERGADPHIPLYQHQLLLKKHPFVAEWRSLEAPLLPHEVSSAGRPLRFTQDFLHKRGSELISSLHFLERWIKILELKGKWLLRCYGEGNNSLSGLRKACKEASLSFEETAERPILDPISFKGARLEFIFTDELQREWVGPYLGVWESPSKEEREKLLSLSLFGAFNRTLFAVAKRKMRD